MTLVFKKLFKVNLEVAKDSSDKFEHLRFYSKSERFLAITAKGLLYLGILKTLKITLSYKLKRTCTAVTTLIADHLTLIALDDGSLIKFDVDEGRVIGSHKGLNDASIRSFSIHLWSERVLSSYETFAVVWDVSQDDPVPLQQLNYSENALLVNAFFNAKDDNIITCFGDGTIAIWDFPSLEFRYDFEVGDNELAEADAKICLTALSGDGRILLVLRKDLKLLMCDFKENTKDWILDGSVLNANVLQMEILVVGNDQGYVALFLTEKGTLQIFDIFANKLILELISKLSFVSYVRFTLSSEYATSGDRPLSLILSDGTLEILNIASLKTVFLMPKTISDDRVDSSSSSEQVKMSADKIPRRPTEIVNLQDIEGILENFPRFPVKYRPTIWRYVLNLPLNRDAFTVLLQRKLHPAYENLEERFPVTDQDLLLDMKKVLSALAHWCPLFGEVSYLPLMVFPFIKTLNENLLICFEVVLTYIVNWCQNWFHFYPAPPLQVLAQIERCLEQCAPVLLAHFRRLNVTSQTYAWPLMESTFCDVFTFDEWLSIYDHIFVKRDPKFLYSLVAAYSVVSQNSLLECSNFNQIQKYFHDKNPIPVKTLLDNAKEIDGNEIIRMMHRFSSRDVRPFQALPKNTYPVFFDYPSVAVENHANLMSKIRKSEAEYTRERRAVLAIEAEFGTLYEQEEEFKRREAILRAAEVIQRDEAIKEERRLLEQRTRLKALKTNLKAKEMSIARVKRLQMARESQLRHESDIAKLEDTTRWLALLREVELMESLEEEEMKHLSRFADVQINQ